MDWLATLCVYTVVSFLVFIMSAIPLQENDYEVTSPKALFVYQRELYKYMRDKFNIFGIVILETIVTALTLGASTIHFITLVITWIFILVWKLFCFAFKKR